MDARQMLLRDHAKIHAATLFASPEARTRDDMPALEDFVTNGLTGDQLRQRPAGHSSIAYLLWHMARNEDVAINTVVRGVPDVLVRDSWLGQLGIDRRDQATGMSDEEVEGFSAGVDIAALHAYRAAVGRETRAWLEQLDFAELDRPIDVAARLAQAPGTFGPRAAWVGPVWEGRSADWFLTWTTIGHAYFHLGEAEHVAHTLGRPGP